LLKKEEVQDFDSERYYTLPVWDSISGFKLMEQFVTVLKNTFIADKLRSTLLAGKGVFRNFKNVLKDYPEVEKQWFSFKEQKMKQVILSWYNDLRDFWGLEQIEPEPEDNSELVQDDFTFRSFRSSDINSLRSSVESVFEDINTEYDRESASVLSLLWKKQREFEDDKKRVMIICESVSEDFAGFAAASYFDEEKKIQNAVLMTSLLILPQFRGLGLGRELLRSILHELKQQNVKKVFFTDLLIPDFFCSVLVREGFSKLGSIFCIDL
jgi:N-acetylglutamate synthase-like GNAT family acetyltransferase